MNFAYKFHTACPKLQPQLSAMGKKTKQVARVTQDGEQDSNDKTPLDEVSCFQQLYNERTAATLRTKVSTLQLKEDMKAMFKCIGSLQQAKHCADRKLCTSQHGSQSEERFERESLDLRKAIEELRVCMDIAGEEQDKRGMIEEKKTATQRKPRKGIRTSNRRIMKNRKQ